MNPINHALITYVILLPFELSIIEIIGFIGLGAILVDADVIIATLRKKGQAHHLRTWIQEPVSLLILWLPIGLVLGLVDTTYIFATLITVAAHIIADYLTIHEVTPLAPIRNTTANVGFIQSFPKQTWQHQTGRFSELYITGLLIALLLI